MSEPHRIRLRGPWEVTAIGNDRATRMTIPCSWKEGGWIGFAGKARHLRSFGRPRQNDSNERVWLVIASVTGTGTIRLNGLDLGTVNGNQPFQSDITDRLEARNQLEIEVESDGDSGGVTGEVGLEIRR